REALTQRFFLHCCLLAGFVFGIPRDSAISEFPALFERNSSCERAAHPAGPIEQQLQRRLELEFRYIQQRVPSFSGEDQKRGVVLGHDYQKCRVLDFGLSTKIRLSSNPRSPSLNRGAPLLPVLEKWEKRRVHPSQRSHAQPMTSVATVIGRPARKYCRNPMCITGLAVSTTIMFATLPVIVRFPARVDAMANISHALCALGNEGTNDFKSMTAGTLLTTLLKAA